MSDDSAVLRLASLVDSSDDAIISTGLDDTVTSWNAGAEKIFGYSAQGDDRIPDHDAVPARAPPRGKPRSCSGSGWASGSSTSGRCGAPRKGS